MITPEPVERGESKLWKSCSGCGSCEPKLLVFVSQFSISLIIVGFCIYMLIMSDSCERDGLYSGTLTLVIGTWLPSPTMRIT
jgi:hypothetical protein